MKFEHLPNTELVQLHTDLQSLIEDPNRIFYLGNAADREISARTAIFLSDKRINDVLRQLMYEAYDAIAERFTKTGNTDAISAETAADPAAPKA